MKIAGQSTLDAAVESIWPLIFDSRTLLELLPGCEQVEQVAPDEYRGRMTLRMPGDRRHLRNLGQSAEI